MYGVINNCYGTVNKPRDIHMFYQVASLDCPRTRTIRLSTSSRHSRIPQGYKLFSDGTCAHASWVQIRYSSYTGTGRSTALSRLSVRAKHAKGQERQNRRGRGQSALLISPISYHLPKLLVFSSNYQMASSCVRGWCHPIRYRSSQCLKYISA
ncbi:uncharacterized protein YALI1_E06468g [Yarrowia lipolytica]|uniref:Uncharacterized protein n=1 Tax=Yarrowia lipolytica TaxID=4952 RepID=A0A1D8NH81_YARLL|nr:hypothetical protein YALI1_E06468g [Yarrowia lipolytica]